MKIPFRIFRKFPKWAATTAILGGSVFLFSCWWLLRGPKRVGDSATACSTAAPHRDIPEFKLDEVVLCGNQLVSLRTGSVLAERWLEGFGDVAPPIARIIPEQKLVICSQNGSATAFTLNGKMLPRLQVDGKALLSAGYSFSDSRILFVKAGNIWSGQADWLNSSIGEIRRVTDTGYFREDSFSGAWFWRDDLLLLPIAGRTHQVDLTTGSVTQKLANIDLLTRGCSPDRNRTAIPSGVGQFTVADFTTGETKEQPIRGRLDQALWIDNDRLVYVSGHSDLMIYDTRSGKNSPQRIFPGSVEKLLAASPRGSCILASSRQQLVQFDIMSQRLSPVDVPFDEVEWQPDEGALIGSCRSSSTGLRGIWRLSRSGELAHIGSEPADSAHGGGGQRPMISTKNGVIWISSGNLWAMSTGDEECHQLTHGLHLSPFLQDLSKKQ